MTLAEVCASMNQVLFIRVKGFAHANYVLFIRAKNFAAGMNQTSFAEAQTD
jgi:hypothetical protein